MALNAFQQAVSNLAKSLGLKGAAEQQVYQRPEFIQLVKQLYGEIPLPPGVDASNVTRNDGLILEYKDAEGYTHRLQRDVNGMSPTLGQVGADVTSRPPILPPPKEQTQAESGLNQQLLGQLSRQFGGMGGTGQGGNFGVPNPPALPNFQGLQAALSIIPRAPQFDFSQLFGQLNQGIPNAPQMPDLSAITGGINNLSSQFGDVFSRLMQPASLGQLSPADLANLAAIKSSAQADSDKFYGDKQGQLIAQLYGRNINQSTIANMAAADFAEAQGRQNLAINSDAAQRQLATQQFISQLGQGNLALAGQTLGQQAQSLGTLGNLALGQGRLGLDSYLGQTGMNLQRLAQLAQAMQGAGSLALGGYQAEGQQRLGQLGQLGQLGLGLGQLGLQSYATQQGLIGDVMSRAIQQLGMLNSQDLNRQVANGQLTLDQARLLQQQQQFNSQLGLQQEAIRAQERAARPSLFDQILKGISGAISIGAAPFTGGTSLFGLLGLGGGGGGQQGFPNVGIPSIPAIPSPYGGSIPGFPGGVPYPNFGNPYGTPPTFPGR